MSCRRARVRFFCAGSLLILLGTMPFVSPLAQPAELKREIFAPAQGRGSIVVVVSGHSGPQPYREFGSRLAEIGYYAVLMDGHDVFDLYNARSDRGQSNLRNVITESQSAAQAIPGKVALLGFSIGGVGVLYQGGPMDEQVSAVVAFYPAIDRLRMPSSELAARLHSPTLVLAAEKDVQNNCCRIESMRALAAARKSAPFQLVVYPNAGHGFNIHDEPFIYRADDDRDAWAKTVAFLTRLHPPRGQGN